MLNMLHTGKDAGPVPEMDRGMVPIMARWPCNGPRVRDGMVRYRTNGGAACSQRRRVMLHGDTVRPVAVVSAPEASHVSWQGPAHAPRDSPWFSSSSFFTNTCCEKHCS